MFKFFRRRTGPQHVPGCEYYYCQGQCVGAHVPASSDLDIAYGEPSLAPASYDLDTKPSYEALEAENKMLTELLGVHGETEAKARHLMNVLGLVSSSGKPCFYLNDQHDEEALDLIRHAILDLQATLDGTEPPALALPAQKDMH